MVERSQPWEENGSTCPTSGQLAPHDARESASAACIEDYLDHVFAPLLGLVPYARRQELRAELRGHLEALTAGYEEMGSSREAAVLMALRQFGPPRELGRLWAREWTQRTVRHRMEPATTAFLTALVSFGLATMVGLVLMGIAGATRSDLSGSVSGLIWLSALYLLPALAGLATGLLAPARHVLGAFYALALLVPALALAGGAQIDPLAPLAKCTLDLAFVQIFCWAPIGCSAAALGGLVRGHRSPRPRRWVLQ